jgi:molecular chaperone HtpG
MTTKTYEFQANISRLMNMIIHSFYSNKDVFLRELISNASDAIDKLRIQNVSEGKGSNDYSIKVSADKEHKTLIIEDNGIGMDEQDLIKNLSTIAQSGTLDFASQLENKSVQDFIGQFGVGFFSSYLVADQVEVYTRKENGVEYHWTSDASSTFSIEESDKNNVQQGTLVILHLRDTESEFLEEHKLRDIIKQHSQFISYPIQLLVEKEEKRTENEIEEETEGETEEETEVKVEETETNLKEETVKVQGWETVNNEKPIWYCKPNEVTEEQYNSFYKTISNDYQEPVYYKHFEAEGSLEFRGILYFPSHPPFDMFDSAKKKRNIKLYVKKVFIMDDCRELVPEWLSFVSGVIDSSDLPLNVSREMLQQNKIVESIKKHIKKQVFSMIENLSQDNTKFDKFYDNFSKNIKLGVYEGENKLAKYLKFNTNLDEDKLTFDEYISKFKEDQKVIYYISGDNLNTIKTSIFLKKFTKLGYRVLLLVEPIDEFMIQRLNKYEDFELVNITKDEITLPEDTTPEECEELCKFIQETLSEKVEKVKVSQRLEDEPTCVVTSKFGWSANMERIMKAQALGDNRNMSFMQGKKILEINPKHSLIEKLKDNINSDPESAKELAIVLYDIALIHAGFQLENTVDFTQKLYNLIK